MITYVTDEYSDQFAIYKNDELIMSGCEGDFAVSEVLEKLEITSIQFENIDYDQGNSRSRKNNAWDYNGFEFPDNISGIQEILEEARLAVEVEKRKRIKVLKDELQDLTNKER